MGGPGQGKYRSAPSCPFAGDSGDQQQTSEKPCQCAGGQRMDDDVGGLEDRGLRAASAPVVQCKRSEEHTSELQSLMRISYAVFCLKKTNKHTTYRNIPLERRHK